MHVKESLYILFCCDSQHVLEYSSTGNEVNGRFILGYSWTICNVSKSYTSIGFQQGVCISRDQCIKGAMYRAYIENYIKYIHISPFCSKTSAWLFASFCIENEKKKSKAVFTDNHMNIDKKNHPQLLPQEQPFIWPMVIQIGLGTGMYVSTYSVLFRFGIFVLLNCIPFQFLCTFHFVSFRSVSLW
jgi:hypothetical protein